jgi:hypothetical protein
MVVASSLSRRAHTNAVVGLVVLVHVCCAKSWQEVLIRGVVHMLTVSLSRFAGPGSRLACIRQGANNLLL